MKHDMKKMKAGGMTKMKEGGTAKMKAGCPPKMAMGGTAMMPKMKAGGATHKMPDGSMMAGKTHKMKAGGVAEKTVNKHEARLHPGKTMTKMAMGGGVKMRGTGAATQGAKARGPMA